MKYDNNIIVAIIKLFLFICVILIQNIAGKTPLA